MLYLGNMFRPPAFLKFGQAILLLIVICIAQAGDPPVGFGYTKHAYFYGAGICLGYLLVYLMLIICYLVGDTSTQRSKFELLLSGLGFAFFLALSIYLFVKSSDYIKTGKTKTIVNGVFTLIIAACQLLDTVFHFRRGDD